MCTVGARWFDAPTHARVSCPRATRRTRATRLVKPPVANGDHPRDVVASANNEQLAGSRRGLLAASAFLPASSLLPVDAARALALTTIPDDDQRYMVGVFRRGVPSFEDWYGMTFGDRARAIKLVKRFGIVRTLVGGNDAMWSDNKAHAVHVFPVSKYDEIHKWHATENEWWPDIALSAERAAQLQTQEKFNGLDDTATLKGPPDAFYFTPSVIADATGGARGVDVLLKTPAKVGSGVAYVEMGLGSAGRGSFGAWASDVLGGSASSEAANGKAKILASVGGASVGGAGDRAAALHWFKSEFKAKAYAFDFPSDGAWAARKKEGRVSAPFHSDNFRVVHDIFW